MTSTPYSNAWREHARERMDRHGLTMMSLATRTGLRFGHVCDALFGASAVSLEIAGPIDECFAKLEARREAGVIRRGELVPVAVDLDALTNCDVVLHGERR